MPESRKGSIFEKYLQSGLGTLGVLLIAWVGVSLNELQKDAAGTAVAVGHIEDDIRTIKLQNLKAYPKDEAQRTWSEHKKDFRSLAGRVRIIEATRTN